MKSTSYKKFAQWFDCFTFAETWFLEYTIFWGKITESPQNWELSITFHYKRGLKHAAVRDPDNDISWGQIKFTPILHLWTRGPPIKPCPGNLGNLPHQGCSFLYFRNVRNLTSETNRIVYVFFLRQIITGCCNTGVGLLRPRSYLMCFSARTVSTCSFWIRISTRVSADPWLPELLFQIHILQLWLFQILVWIGRRVTNAVETRSWSSYAFSKYFPV